MTNIIRTRLSVAELAAVFANCPLIPLLPPRGDAAWLHAAANPVMASQLRQMCDRAESEIDQTLPALTDEMYADFHATGVRLRFETKWFERRRQLAHAVVAALVEQEPVPRDRFLASVVTKMKVIFSEDSWSFPAHVGNIPTGKDPMRIDLFAAETANLFGELLNLLGPSIDQTFAEQIRARLNTQYFENYLANTPDWAHATHNWNAVCHQGVLGAALAVCDDPQLLGRLFERASEGLAYFLNGFTADGGSSEGPGYWGYGFGWFAELNRQLEARTRGQLSLFEGDPLVYQIALFGPRLTLTNGYVVNFADGSARATPRASLLQYLGERFDDPLIKAHAAHAWKRTASVPLNFSEQRGDVFHYSRMFLRCPTKLDPNATLPDTDLYLPDLGVALTRFHDGRGHVWEWAGKGGHNNEHHNHNDLGSFLLNIDGSPLLTEIGAPEYNKAFFSSKRYESIATRSLGHPVPLVNGVEQIAGKDFAAPVLMNEFTAEHVRLKLDMTSAYPAAAGCKRCDRSIELTKNLGKLVILDSFEFDRVDSLETAIITHHDVQLAGGRAAIANDGNTLLITPAAGTTITEVQRHEYSDHGGKPAHIHRIVLRPALLAAHTTIGFAAELQ
ncbi:heparinase II/III family protein [soil metagenome]